MEINITKFFNECAPRDYSASVAEIGNNAGADTWRAAIDDSQDYSILDTDEKREAFKAYMQGFGAWEESEIASWDNEHCEALCMQLLAGDMRESGLDARPVDWEQYEKDSEAGIHAGRIYQGDDGEIYFYCGS